MKRLTIALLLSLAPLAINANNCGSCDRSEELQTEQSQADDERCCNLAELVLLDAIQAYDATQVAVTIVNETLSTDEWNHVVNVAKAAYGSSVTADAQEINFVIERNDLSAAEWFEMLAEAEAKVGKLTGAVVNFQLN